MTLAASATTVAAGEQVTLIATANQDIGATPYYVSIFNTTEDSQLANCGTGATCTTFVRRGEATTLQFTAYISGLTGGEVSDVQATSTPVTVTWGGGASTWTVTLTASTSSPAVGESVTLTATADQDIGSSPYYITIFNGSGTRLATCGSGLTCTATASTDVAETDTFVAVLGDESGTQIQAESNEVLVSWGGAAPPSFLLEHVDRVNGVNRYDTAAMLAETRWAPGVAAVFVVTGENYPDALAAARCTSSGKASAAVIDDGHAIARMTASAA